MLNAGHVSLEDIVGLCHRCAHHREIRSSKGSVFYLCLMSERDARFPKYPRLPVHACAGFTSDTMSDHNRPGSDQPGQT